MNHKKTIIWGAVLVVVSVIGVLIFFSIEKNKTPAPVETPKVSQEKPAAPEKPEPKETPKQVSKNVQKVEPKKTEVKKYVYENSSLPFSAASILADLPSNVKDKVNGLIENSQGLYLLGKSGDKITLILENSEDYPRHEVEINEIDAVTAEETSIPIGYKVTNDETDEDIWEYDKKTHLPTMHIKYNQQGEVEYTEFWHYSAENPVKYELKDRDGKILSIKKETPEGDMGLRLEHIVYDKDGNTKINLSAAYDGADIKRVTYYNADKPDESSTIISDYTDGQKVKETVYTPDLKIKNVYKANYVEGEMTDITVLDNNNEEVEKILTK